MFHQESSYQKQRKPYRLLCWLLPGTGDYWSVILAKQCFRGTKRAGRPGFARTVVWIRAEEVVVEDVPYIGVCEKTH